VPRRNNHDHLEIGRLRLVSQRLVGSTFRAPAEAVRFLLAMQAQDFHGATWSIGLRVRGSTRRDVDEALASGAIVRSWPMRGTLHFTAGDDLPWLLDLLAPRVLATTRRRHVQLELAPSAFERAGAVASDRLSGGRRLTREALLAAFTEAGLSIEGQRGYHLLGHLAHTQLLCFGPPSGTAQTFVLFSEWIRRPRRLERDEALGELAHRYFRGHGPATLKDFLGWAQLTVAEGKKALAIVGSRLSTVTLNDTVHWLAADARDLLERHRSEVEASTLALPGFDEYVLGYKDRSAVLAPKFFEQIVPGGNGVFKPTIVVDGQVVGTWQRTQRGRTTTLEPIPFTRLSRAQRQQFEHSARASLPFLQRQDRPA
jgi:Winged helix DNA-binding domain